MPLNVPFGKYLLLDKIASGGMAEVFRAVLRGAAGFEKPVALKRILPVFGEEAEFVTLFQDEARIASTLGHANIAQVFDFGEVDGTYYLAMELVDGLDLNKLGARLRAAGQPMPLATACTIVAEAARGLAYAHEQRGPDGNLVGIVHRDVSPANLLISRAGEVKVADFGIAKAAGKVHKTETGVVMGKLRYMSPEQIDAGPLDARSDIFALGVILYELLASGPIFAGEPGARLAELIRSAPIPPPSTRNPAVPAELDAIVLRALARPPDERYASASEMARDLTVFVSSTAPGFTREDLGALVRSHAPPPGAAPPVEGAALAPTHNLRAPDKMPSSKQRSLSGAGWLAIVLALVIAVSGALAVFRFVMPGRETLVPDAARLAAAAVDAGALAVEPPPTAPFTLLATASADERRALTEALENQPVSRRGLAQADYAAYLTGLDSAIASLTIGADGLALTPRAPPPPVAAQMARFGVEPAVAATVEYLVKTGELPPLVKSAVRSFLAGRPSVSAAEIAVQGGVLPPYSAAALAVWLEGPSKQRLFELAHANDILDRWCPPPAPPARSFAPVLCEPAAVIAELRKIDPKDATAAALDRVATATNEVATDGGVLAVETARYEATSRPDEMKLTVVLSAETSAVVVAGGARGEVSSPLHSDGEKSYSAVVPLRIVAPVLRMAGGQLHLPAPPFGGL